MIVYRTVLGLIVATWLTGAALAEPDEEDNQALDALTALRFETLTDCGAVLDRHKRLMWQRCTLGQVWNGNTCVGRSQRMEWDHAAVHRYEHCGFADWHLPELVDLEGLIVEGSIPAIDERLFPNTPPGSYWSASTVAPNSPKAWTVDFGGFGLKNTFKDDRFFVRFVREAR